ncbi:phosphoserine phosphatase SerB [Sphingomonas colocasiae]|uniref:Phosphoserine phosphatase n=1 Tax=Sphingomonas colocasiae TaxID=1848973 RepID=A0ABS7PII1_9SPHN|nr:phosphoserine phosphatase SerB [Sphingomonas colocasiae]MBY8821112.1 phosphoserine phosphatase SerB [Sphingomonas colocasiae]
MFILTLIADGLSAGDTSDAADRLRAVGCAPGEGRWIDEGMAFDLRFTGDPAAARRAAEGQVARADAIVQREAAREKALIVSDMDSTMITVECIDELADYAGLRAEISAVTERAMQGELDFEAALDARVALLKGMDVSILETCYRERVRLMPGAEALVRTMRARGGAAVLVSGGFTHFADPVAAAIGFDRAISNRLGMADGKLDGTVGRPIVGAEAKREALLAAMAEHGVPLERTLAVGDGANDIPMIEAAGLGIAYHAKEKAAAAADARVMHGDLTALLYAQGIARRDWVN